MKGEAREEERERKTTRTNAGAASSIKEEEEAKNAIEQVPHWAAREFTEGRRVFTETFPIRFDEVGPNKLADMGTMARISQESCATAPKVCGAARSLCRKICARWTWPGCARDYIWTSSNTQNGVIKSS